MTVKDRLEKASKNLKTVIDIQQASTVREDGGVKPIGVNMSVEDNHRLFNSLMELRSDLDIAMESIKMMY